ncbi:hypothetical protein EJ08DRAFT_693431 [Tothia fuscella]|uniref:Uncharacterized protein n=1 Tax=Tothia fuscella TaxID=1048955 RepID=A0A9P4U2X5_9PEZI|nr:hypothetical protein EJ08DRAFT_693431 [Tothia fuscella]
MAPGIMYVLTKPHTPYLSLENYNKWYTEAHIEDAISCGLADLAIRYKNTNPDAKWPYLCVYRLPDLEKLSDEKLMGSIPTKHELLPDGKSWSEVMDAKGSAYRVLQKFEGWGEKEGPRGKALRTVMVEPAEGGEEEFDEWYRKQHLDMLSMVTGFRRSTRYQLVEKELSGEPRFLACHEYETTDFPVEEIKRVTGTEWSKKMFAGFKSFEGEVWEVIAQAGKVEEKL